MCSLPFLHYFMLLVVLIFDWLKLTLRHLVSHSMVQPPRFLQLVSYLGPPKNLKPRIGPTKMAAPPTDEEGQSNTRRSHTVFGWNGNFPKKVKIRKCLKGNDCFYKCGKPDHLIKYCPFCKLKYKDLIKNNSWKARNKGAILDECKRSKGDSTETSIMVVEVENSTFNSLISFTHASMIKMKKRRVFLISKEPKKLLKKGTKWFSWWISYSV